MNPHGNGRDPDPGKSSDLKMSAYGTVSDRRCFGT